MTFSRRGKRSSWNRLRDTIDEADYKAHEHMLDSIEVEVDTLDNIIADHGLDDVSFINMTINGSEYPAIQGMTETLQKDVILSFPIQNILTIRSPILSELEEKGYNIRLKHAPVATHQKQFIVACAMKRSRQEILDDGYEEVELAVSKKDNHDFIRIIPKDSTDKYDRWVFQRQVAWF